MEEGRRSGDPSGFMVKNRSSSGCLVVRKKGNGAVGGVGSSGSHNVFGSKKEKKRARMDLSDSGSSDELLMPPRRRVGPETIRVCNGLNLFDKGIIEENDIGRKRSRGENFRSNEIDRIDRNEEDFSERKRNRLEVFEFDEYDGNDSEMMRRNHFDDGRTERRRFFGSMMARRSSIEREYEMGSTRHPVVDRRKSSYFERESGLNRGDHGDRDGSHLPMSFYRDKYDSDEPIRVQGKNGVLKVMVNKKKKVDGSLKSYDGLEMEEKRKGLRTEDSDKRNALIRPSFFSDSRSAEKASSFVGSMKNPMNMLRSSAAKKSSTRNGKVRYHDSEDSDTSLKLGSKNVEARNSLKTPLPTINRKGHEVDSEDSDTSLKLGMKSAEACKSMKGASSGGEITPSNQLPPAKVKEGKVKRGTGTEKQKLREKIRGMLLNAGWTIDYRPRRNRDYLDAVYINPTGTAYWSIIKAYDALLKQLNDEEEEAKSKADVSSFMPLSDEVLSQLTRKTRKKMEKEMKKKQRDDSESEKARELTARKSSSSRNDEESMDSGSHEEKLSSFIRHGGKSSKGKMNGNSSLNTNTKGQRSAHHLHGSVEKISSGSNSHQGRKSRKLGRCTLLVRNSNEGLNSESDGFVPYAGKRTLLSWLIDIGTVQLSQKVRYMNRRRTKVMLEGWVTRDGIHCGCCSKILTVSKFEIHAGSKLRQPFQNIYLDSGLSLLECQIDAWNRQESIEHIGFHSVDVDGDDPNDDTCGLCGDGGDLICCDTCPSTFHQSCLDIKMLPPGDWHCPNCTCKFCRIASVNIIEGDDTAFCELLTCSLCAKKYHKSCIAEMDALSVDMNCSNPSFCGKTCRELFEQLQKYLGVKHELEAGFSWSLIHRTDVDLDVSIQGLPQRVECNSKLAVALSVMDECFLPIVDRRSGINLIHNVLYNCGSNFNRLNYSGFYAVILERGDEIICAASIRIHGTQLAEMPFIGTRHIYRRQGMCRRLLCAIESALCSLKVQKLIIPAISELTNTWTEVFGFTTLDGSLRQELKSINMLVFPGIDMLQKQLLGQENIDGNRSTTTGAKGMGFKDSQSAPPEVAVKCDMDSSAMQDVDVNDNGCKKHDDEVATTNTDSQCMDVSINDIAVTSSSLDVSHDLKSSVPLKEAVHTDSDSGDKSDESAMEKKSICISDTIHDLHKMDNKAESDSAAEEDTQPCSQGDMPSTNSLGGSLNNTSVMSGSSVASDELKYPISHEKTSCADPESGDKLAELTSDSKCLIISDMSGNRHVEHKSEVFSSVKGDIQYCQEGDLGNAHVLNLNESTSDELKNSFSMEETKYVSSQSEDKFTELLSNGKHHFDSSDSNGATEMGTTTVVDSPVEDNSQSGTVDAHTVNFDACLEAVQSMKDTTSDDSISKINEIPICCVSALSNADKSSMQISSDLNDEMVCERGNKSDVTSESVCDERDCEGSVPHAPADNSMTDESEGKTKSSSI
ncbi:hypothetical protein JCGZ_02169 [Jatropha curcas]|uniref:PHD-type domain-containing protein n=1 Tax=Jatropha curcas TaxID=180498 RepID=A0A067KVD6_JATCU|nr:uncharacterized protein LOC105631983 [Jatropha curcas]KDP40171.1 hypothetical protein JCGZ_02169 [Jatropha curcas]